MSLQEATDLIRYSLILALLVSAPMLIIGLVVGIVVSLVQALTQIQEQTLTFIPKIVSMVAAAIVLMPWIAGKLLDYSAAVFGTGSLRLAGETCRVLSAGRKAAP
jgi:flagellar biosynthetic protein FliQ